MSAKRLLNLLFVQPIDRSTHLDDEQRLKTIHQAALQCQTDQLALMLINEALLLVVCADKLVYFLRMAQNLSLLTQIRPLDSIVNVTNNDGDTALILALRNEHFALATYLINAGADINKANKNGETPLILASWHNHQPLIMLLIAKQASTDARDMSGKTALDYALKNKNQRIVSALSL